MNGYHVAENTSWSERVGSTFKIISLNLSKGMYPEPEGSVFAKKDLTSSLLLPSLPAIFAIT